MALQRLLLRVVLLVTMVTGEVLQEYNIGIMINRADTYLESYNVSSSCELLKNNISLVISPDNSDYVGLQADIFNRIKVPFIATSATDPYLKTGDRTELLMMAPSDEFQAEVILDILTHYGWTDLAIIASDSNYGIHGVTILQQLLSETTAEDSVVEEFDIEVYFFNAVEDVDRLDLADILKNVERNLERVFILHCEDLYARVVLEKAQADGLMDSTFVWIVTEGIASAPQSLLVEKFQSRPSRRARGYYPAWLGGLLGLSLYINTTTPPYKEFKNNLMEFASGSLDDTDIITVTAMVYDAVMMAGTVLQRHETELGSVIDHSGARCGGSGFDEGAHIFEHLTNISYQGVTGAYSFSAEARNTQVAAYNILNFVDEGQGYHFNKIGTWHSSRLNHRLEITNQDVTFLGGLKSAPIGLANNLEGQVLKIGVLEVPPFAMKKHGCESDSVECWIGICPEILFKMSRDLNFTYHFIQPKQKVYGTFNKVTNTWSGLIGDLLDNKIDLIAMDLSVSSERRAWIDFTYRSHYNNDFTYSYIDTGISVVMKGESKTSNTFFFLTPFGITTWCAILIAIVVIAILQNIFGKLSPFDEHGIVSHAQLSCKCDACLDQQTKSQLGVEEEEVCLVETAEEEVGTHKMSVYNALWVVGSGFVGQGGEPLPRSPSGRTILVTWWFFVMLYHLYMCRLNCRKYCNLLQGVPIKRAVDLLNQRPGLEMDDTQALDDLCETQAIDDLSALSDTPESSSEPAEYKWGMIHDGVDAMLLKSHVNDQYKHLGEQSLDVVNFENGMRLVNEGKFAYIEDSLWLEYNISSRCDIFLYREEGFFAKLWETWGRGESTCDRGNVGNEKRLSFYTLKGIFYFLVLGLIISFVFLIVELLVATARDQAESTKTTFWAKLKNRLALKLRDIRMEWCSVFVRRKKRSKRWRRDRDGVERNGERKGSHSDDLMKCYLEGSLK
nr:ionotropic glutamate receptor-12 [Pleurobrachia bachei]